MASPTHTNNLSMRILAAMGVKTTAARVLGAHLSMEPNEYATINVRMLADGNDVQELADACRDAGVIVVIQPVAVGYNPARPQDIRSIVRDLEYVWNRRANQEFLAMKGKAAKP